MSRYPHLLSPIKIGNTIFKNRLIASRSSPRYVQGSEPFPTEALITHYANKARNGAAVVTCGGVGMPHIIPEDLAKSFTSKTILPGSFDIYDAHCRNYLAQLADAIHFYGGKASMQIGGFVPLEYDVSSGIPSVDIGIGLVRTGKEIPADYLDEVAEDFARQAEIMREVGFDMVYLHMAYRLTILGRFLSPLTNKRKDEFGGSLENMARFPLMVADRIKQRCGKDFLIEASISGYEPPGGRTLEETVKLAHIFAGHIDILQVRTHSIDPAHPTGFEADPTPFLYLAEAVKKSGAEIAVATVGGYLDPEKSEEAIATGKADFIAMARGWISNPEYGRLLYEGRGEDIIPCIRCNRCLGGIPGEPPVSVCSVNPIWGLEHKIERIVSPPVRKKKVAVIGGGPAGMGAALIAASRGHHVTLYEKGSSLGGLLRTADNVAFKWPVKQFKDYLIRQVNKAGVKVRLNTDVTPEMVQKAGYDAVLVAVGSRPIVPYIPGVDGKNVFFVTDVFGKEDVLDKDVVIVGGGEVGVETGIHLAQKGHNVTVLEMMDRLAPNAPRLHYYTMFQEAWEKLPNFKYILKARCTAIGQDKVTYVDDKGMESSIPAGSVVIAVGMQPKQDLAIKFSGVADTVFIIGDCVSAGNIQKAMRSAFSIASMI